MSSSHTAGPAPTGPEPTLPPSPPSDRTILLPPSLPALGEPLPAVDGAAGLIAVPGYEVLEELGRGAMGVVYKARQLKLNRVVALKMVLAGAHASSADLIRFLAEAEAVGQLQHANIVHVHEVGQHGGLPFFSMEYVHGGTLAQRLGGRPQQPRQAAQLIEALARAMQHAHECGIVHRDLKPANVMLAADGTPKVADFGLAKRQDLATHLTATGAIVGTPSYMAPEQAEAHKDVTSAVDVYALGAILYECLTGRPPFQGPTPLDTVLQVVSREPVPPSQLQPKLPRDLETVCLKCLQKSPAKRYASAADLADDLGRFQLDQPITARPIGRVERGWRWCRRNPAVASMTAGVALLLLLLAGGASVSALWLREERNVAQAKEAEAKSEKDHAEEAERKLAHQLHRTREAERDKTEKLWQSYVDRARAGRFSRQPGQRFDSLDALAAAARLRTDQLLRDETIACLALPDLRLGPPLPLWPAGTTDLAFDLDWRQYAHAGAEGIVRIGRLSDHQEVARLPPGLAVTNLFFSPDGRRLGMFRAHRGLEVWDVPKRRRLLTGLPYSWPDFSPDGKRLVVGGGAHVSLYDLTTRGLIWRQYVGRPVGAAAFSPDGQRVACMTSGYRDVLILDARSGSVAARAEPPGGTVCHAAWGPDGRLLVGLNTSRAYILRPRDWRIVATFEGHAQDVVDVAFHPGGGLVYTGSWDGTSRLWNAWTGQMALARVGRIRGARFSRDGRRLGYVVEGTTVRPVEVADGREHRTLVSSEGAGQDTYRRGAFSPDGRLFAAGTDTGLVLWDLATGRELAFVRQGQTECVAFTSAGEELLTSGAAGLRRWPIRTDKAGNQVILGPPRGMPLPVLARTFSLARGGTALAYYTETGGLGGFADLTKGGRGAPANVRPITHRNATLATLSADGRWAATMGWHATEINLWDVTARKVVKLAPPGSAHFSPSEKSKVMVISRAEEFLFWEIGTWRELRRVKRENCPYPTPPAFTADGRVVALEVAPGILRLEEAASGRALAHLEGPHRDRPGWLSFSPDGGLLINQAQYARTIRVWDLTAIRRRLASVGLDWGREAAPPAGKEAGPRKWRVVWGSASPADPAKIVTLPRGPRRSAQPGEVARWVDELKGPDPKTSARAAQALVEVGAPAREALVALAARGDAEARRRARDVLDQINLAEALAPTRLRLKLAGAKRSEAVAALARQAPWPIVLDQAKKAGPEQEKLLDLDVEGAPFYETLDRFCRAAGLTYAVKGGRYVLVDGAPPPANTIAYAGPFRLAARSMFSTKRLALAPGTPLPGTASQLSLGLSLRAEPLAALLAVGTPRIAEAWDDRGQSLPLLSPKGKGLLSWQSSPVERLHTLPLTSTARPGAVLKRLRVALPVEILAGRDELASVELTRASAAPGRSVRLPGGARLTVQSARRSGTNLLVRVEVTATAAWQYDPKQHSFELVDRRGLRRRPLYAGRLSPAPSRPELGPSELALLAGLSGVNGPGVVPWGGLAMRSPQASTWAFGELTFSLTSGTAGQKLVFVHGQRVRTELSFELRDLPLR